MLTFFIIIILKCSSAHCCSPPHKDNLKLFNVIQVDSFWVYYNQLQSVLKKNPFDTSLLTRSAVHYMEVVTKIKAHPDGNYIGWVLFTGRDLIAWQKWKRDNE